MQFLKKIYFYLKLCVGGRLYTCVVPKEAREGIRSPGALAGVCELLVGAPDSARSVLALSNLFSPLCIVLPNLSCYIIYTVLYMQWKC